MPGPDLSVLVIAGLGQRIDGEVRTEKIDAHVRPMTHAADRVTYLTIAPTPSESGEIDCRRLSPSGSRILDFLRLGIATIRLARTGRYDVLASFSLVPYGLFALIGKLLSGRPAHLGIIGMDLDVHATGRTGPFVRWTFRRFDAVSIAGSEYAQRLRMMGVPQDRIYTILHPVDTTFAEARPTDPAYDLLWVGRMSPEKDPLRFVSVVERLHDQGIHATAAMVGDGPIFDDVAEAVGDAGLDEEIELAGWSPEPVEYYRRARLYVLTSEREMLPLTVVESMLVGVPVIAPSIGAIPDIVEDGADGFLIDDRSVQTYVGTIESALSDPDRLRGMGERARTLQDELSEEAVGESWAGLFVDIDPSTVRSRGSPVPAD